MKKLIIIFALTMLMPLQALALDLVPAPYGYIADEADIFSAEFETELESTLALLEEETTAEIGILTINSLEDEYIEGYALEIFRSWGIGQAGADNGLLLLIAVEDREMRIEVGYGLEGAVTDVESSWIIDYTIAPNFQTGDYETGVREGINDLEGLIRGEAELEGFDLDEYYATQAEEDEMIKATGASLVGGVLVFVFLVASLGFFEEKGRKKFVKYPVPLFIMAAIALIVQVNWVGWVLCAGIGLFIQLFLVIIAYAPPGRGGSSGSSGSGWTSSSGSSSSSSSFGGSSGGQSFGGGSSGGGGASGKW